MMMTHTGNPSTLRCQELGRTTKSTDSTVDQGDDFLVQSSPVSTFIPLYSSLSLRFHRRKGKLNDDVEFQRGLVFHNVILVIVDKEGSKSLQHTRWIG